MVFDAESYALQLIDKHEKVAIKGLGALGPVASNAYTPPPIGFYLRGMLRESTHANYDDALRPYELTAQFPARPKLIALDIQRVSAVFTVARAMASCMYSRSLAVGPTKL